MGPSFAADGSQLALQIAVAVTLLMLGRRLYWLFVAGIGFVLVMGLASDYLDVQEGWMTMALAVAAGVAGALLAVFVQKLAVTLAGFAAASYVAAVIAEEFGKSGQLVTLAVLAAGVLGGILSIAMGLQSFLLPHTPPKKEGVSPWAFLESFKMLRVKDFAIFIGITFVVATELEFYYILTAPFLESAAIGVPHPLKDQEVVAFCVLNEESVADEILRAELLDLMTLQVQSLCR